MAMSWGSGAMSLLHFNMSSKHSILQLSGYSFQNGMKLIFQILTKLQIRTKLLQV